MPYARLGALDLTNVADASYGSDGSGGIDWTSVITTGEQVVGQVATGGQPVATRYPTYYPTSSAFSSQNLGSSLVPLLLLGGVAFFALRRR